MRAYDDPQEEPPLDPAQERLRRKLARLLVVSGGIMLLGLIAVFSAIVYKLGVLGDPSGSLPAPVEARLAVPAGHRVLATSLDGERAMLTLAAPDGSTVLLLVDLPSGTELGRYAVVPGE